MALGYKDKNRLVEYFITVGMEFESVSPINDESLSFPIKRLCVINDKEPLPLGFERISQTVTGKDASLTKKSKINYKKSSKHYLCISRESETNFDNNNNNNNNNSDNNNRNEFFSRILYVKSKAVDPGWTKVDGKIGKTGYCFCIKYDKTIPPIADICIISNELKEKCPHGYVELPIKINGLSICCRHLPVDALGLRYQTCILDRYPRIDYPNSPLSNTVAVFCQPNGADIRNNAPLPTFLTFVLTDAEGQKMYAICVTFYDEMKQNNIESVKKATESMYNGSLGWPKDDKFYHSKSVAILSYFPFFKSFRECLKEIYRVANSPGKIPIEVYIFIYF